MSRIRIWDLPVRAFHWLLVVLVPLQWWTAEEEMMDLHILLGQITLGLILFRLFWGLIGSSTARFAGFVRGPRAMLAYLSGRLPPAIGHNPVGALSVLAMLALLALQVGLGLFASDEDGLYSGPLAHWIDGDLSEEFADWHETNFDVLMVVIGLHVAAILFYLVVKRDNLVAPMVTGAREGRAGEAPLAAAPAWRFAVAAAAAAGLTLWIASGL